MTPTRAPLGHTTVTRPLAPFGDATGPSSATTGRPTTIGEARAGACLRQARNAQRPRPHPQQASTTVMATMHHMYPMWSSQSLSSTSCQAVRL